MNPLPFLLVLACFACSGAQAQQSKAEIGAYVDSLINRWYHDSVFASTIPDDSFYFQKMQDSLLMALVEPDVRKLTDKDEYTWPGDYIRERLYRMYQDTSIPATNGTGDSLLARKYHMRWRGGGCVVREIEIAYDLAMFKAIQRRWGQDFFVRLARESDSLDGVGAGLRLPCIRDSATTASALRQAYRYFYSILDTPKFAEGAVGALHPRYLEFEFKKGTVVAARLLNASWAYSVANEFAIETDKLSRIARTLAWTPPMFLRQPVDALVVWDFRTGRITWKL